MVTHCGDGDLIVKTSLGKTISRKNKGPNNDTDQGQFDVEVSNGIGPEDIFWNKNITPPSGNYSICAEPYYFSPPSNITNPVTFTVHVRTPPTKTMMFTKTMTQSSSNNLPCSSTSSIFVAIFQYP